jgi:translation initiation factor IF-2
MLVSELAKELKTTTEKILSVLKSLRLKAKDGNQELSAAVVSVIRSEFGKDGKKSSSKDEKSEISKTSKSKTTQAKEEKKSVSKKTTEKKPKSAPVKKTVIGSKKEEKKPEKKKELVEKVNPAAAVVEENKKVEPPLQAQKVDAPKVEAPKPTFAADKFKVKPKFSKEPLITLKPLARKRRKMGPGYPAGVTGYTPGSTIEGETHSASSGSSVAVEEKPQVDVSTLPEIEIKLPITVKDLSLKLQQKPSAILMHLMKMGILTHINQSLDDQLVQKVVQDFGFNLAKIKTQEEQVVEIHKKEDEDPKLLKPRAPVVTFMGHVDHGKTSLLDNIRKARVADSEHGGITQHIGAYSVTLPKGRITFLDTPGHEAFTAMRARGATITDIVVLVVAADEGIMPQTEEAIDHAKAANVPIVVALNKIDKPSADPDRVKKQLMELGLHPEDWGGKTVVVGVSAHTGQGINELLEMLLLESEMLELKANYDKPASGTIVEAHLSKGKGVVATMIVQGGNLKESDYIVVGPHYGRVKALFDHLERPIKQAGPSTPVEILGLPAVPEAGETFYVVSDEKLAREISAKRQEHLKSEKLRSSPRISLENIFSEIKEGKIRELNIVIKADVQGSLEALKDSLEKIPSDRVKVRIIHMGVGEINASDVLLAAVSKAIIIAFHVSVGAKAKEELQRQPVDVREYRIIYDAVDDMRKALEGLLEVKTKKKFMARVEVRQVFKLSKHGIVAGCYVQKGRVTRKDKVDVLRNGEIVHSSTISTLKRFKDDVREVTEGMECGISVSGYDKYQEGDLLETYEVEVITQKL